MHVLSSRADQTAKEQNKLVKNICKDYSTTS